MQHGCGSNQAVVGQAAFSAYQIEQFSCPLSDVLVYRDNPVSNKCTSQSNLLGCDGSTCKLEPYDGRNTDWHTRFNFVEYCGI